MMHLYGFSRHTCSEYVWESHLKLVVVAIDVNVPYLICHVGLSKSDSLVKIKSRAEQKASSGGGGAAGGDTKDEMVAIVGRGYSEDSVEAPPTKQLATQVKSKQRRQSTQKPSELL